MLLGSPCLPVMVYQCMTLHSIEYADSATCGGATVLLLAPTVDSPASPWWI